MQCVTRLLIHVDTGLQQLYLPLLVMGHTDGKTLYNVMAVKRHIMPVDLLKVRVSVELR